MLEYIVPDFVHVLYKGRIVKSGGKELAFELEEKGYDFIKQGVTEEVIKADHCSERKGGNTCGTLAARLETTGDATRFDRR